MIQTHYNQIARNLEMIESFTCFVENSHGTGFNYSPLGKQVADFLESFAFCFGHYYCEENSNENADCHKTDEYVRSSKIL